MCHGPGGQRRPLPKLSERVNFADVGGDASFRRGGRRSQFVRRVRARSVLRGCTLRTYGDGSGVDVTLASQPKLRVSSRPAVCALARAAVANPAGALV